MLDLSWIVSSLGRESVRGEGNPSGRVSGVSVDTREGCSGKLFVALAGENSDGHDFLEEALDSGAAALLVSREDIPSDSADVPVFLANDTLQALQKLAADYRAEFPVKCIGITGTAGKTETKELLASILSRKYRVHATYGNYNNHIGVPLTILSMERGTDVLVVEMGANHEKEIELLASIARPEIGVITNIGPGHIEFFKTLRGVARAKSELIQSLPEGGLAVLPSECEFNELFISGSDADVVTFGFSGDADWRVEIIEHKQSGGYIFELNGERIGTDMSGRFHLLNIAASAAVCSALDAEITDITAAVEDFTAVDRRGSIYKVADIIFVNDSYNSNPLSLRSSIEAFMEMPVSGRRWLVLGDMLELGEAAADLHREMGEFCGKAGVYGLVTLGEQTVYLSREAAGGRKAPEKISHFINIDKLSHFLNELLESKDAVLLKGSRDMGMWRVIDGIEGLRETERRRVD